MYHDESILLFQKLGFPQGPDKASHIQGETIPTAAEDGGSLIFY
jgi:hypothetical protein